jgi:hypothetical protein
MEKRKETVEEKVVDESASAEVGTDPETGETTGAVEKQQTVERTERTEVTDA